MTTLPAITEQDVRARVGDQSFQRGQEYFRSGAIIDARRQGMTLKARCEGTSAPYYRLSVTFDDKGIAAADCSCPVGSGGHCKHVAALLLTWLDRPEAFVEVEELDTALARRSKEELVALVKQLLRRHPELDVLLETPLPTPLPAEGAAGSRSQQPVDPEVYRRQARAAFRGIVFERAYGTETGVVAELEPLMEIGDGLVEQQDYAGAAAVYQAVADAVLENYETFHDEFGELSGVVQQCVEGIAGCLEHAPEGDPAREAIVKALFYIYHSDVEHGGLGLGSEVPALLREHTTAAERRMVAGWVRDSMPRGGDRSDDWRRRRYGDFLLELERDDLDDEAFLRICREAGRTRDLVDRLLALGRVNEAAKEAEQAGDYELLQLAAVFEQYGQGALAERLVEQRAKTSKDSRLLMWLKQRYVAQGKPADALAVVQQLFRGRPSFETYQEIRDLAQRLSLWQELHPKLHDQLRKASQTVLLIRIYLDEGEIDRALELVQAANRSTSPSGYGYGTGVDVEVARAAEETRPRASIEIYERQVERLIAQRNRPSYGAAAALAQRVRAAYERLGEQDAWARYIAGLRDRYRSLRALKEELTKAGL
ncbi:MAG: SWIM zinc finger family protein [Chloroflexi bacterium]|nr:SWIM zinc finger family protein [Chloroflexota bacterium]